MIRLLLVEDESPIRNGIYRHVHWQELGVDEVYLAENAEKALLIGEEHLPEIIVSDIHMPGMIGTDLCRAYREIVPDCQIIFISGYSDKEYLTAAIELGAVSYIEKPIDIRELSETISRAVTNIRGIDLTYRNALHSLFAAGNSNKMHAQHVCEAVLARAGGRFSHHLLILLHSREALPDLPAIGSDARGELQERYEDESWYVMSDDMGSCRYALLFSSSVCWDDLMCSKLCRILLSLRSDNARWFLSASEDLTDLSDVGAALPGAVECLKNLSFMGWNTWTRGNPGTADCRFTLSAETMHSFYKALADKNCHSAEQIVDACCSEMCESRYVMSFAVRNVFYALNQELARAESALGSPKDDQEDMAFLDEAETIAALGAYVRDRIRRMLTQSREQKQNYAVKTVCAYIRKHMQEPDLSTGILAEHVYLTPAYLSGLFKRTMGITLMQYITEVRMERARELLADPQMKLYQVANEVGYMDPKYFSRQFKKTVSMTPTEYRDQLPVMEDKTP